MRVLFLVLAALSAALPCFAHEPSPVERIQVPGIGRLDYQRLFEEVSKPGETLDAFALRIGPRLRAYSDATGFEACGVLATDGERFGVVVGTNRAHIACANRSAFVPAGMKTTGETIHSHGLDSSFQVNRSDRLLLRLPGTAMVTMSGQKLDAFSPMDFHGGPGYLVTPTGVLHQQGTASSVRDVRHTSEAF